MPKIKVKLVFITITNQKITPLAWAAEPKFIKLRNAFSLQHNGFQRCQPKTGLVFKVYQKLNRLKKVLKDNQGKITSSQIADYQMLRMIILKIHSFENLF